MPLTVRIEPHPSLELAAFVARFERPLGELATPDLSGTTAPLPPIDTKTAVRDLLRVGGFKPAGRSKPASEYLAAAAAEGRWPTINPMVDACNVVSLHAGLPISVVDVDKTTGELSIRIAPPATTYVFNPSGQVIDASGLVCLYDAQGPTGTPVKDAQRTKTDDATRAALVIVWGTRALAGRADAAARWYRALVAAIPGAAVDDVAVTSSSA